MGKKQRRTIAEALASVAEDQPRVILATGSYIGEGFDDARLDTLFLAMPSRGRGRSNSMWGDCTVFMTTSELCRFTTT